MKTHLSTCPRIGRRSIVTDDIAEVDCSDCIKHGQARAYAVESAAAERRIEAEQEAACRAAGMGHLWDALSPDSAYERIVRGMLASVAAYFVETADPEQVAA